MSSKAERANWPVHVGRLGDEEPNPYAHLTPEERVGMVWALTCEAYGIDPENPPPMRKDIVRIGRIQGQ